MNNCTHHELHCIYLCNSASNKPIWLKSSAQLFHFWLLAVSIYLIFAWLIAPRKLVGHGPSLAWTPLCVDHRHLFSAGLFSVSG